MQVSSWKELGYYAGVAQEEFKIRFNDALLYANATEKHENSVYAREWFYLNF